MEVELEHLIGVKVVEVSGDQIRFDNGTVIMFHPYETYVHTKEDFEQ